MIEHQTEPPKKKVYNPHPNLETVEGIPRVIPQAFQKLHAMAVGALRTSGHFLCSPKPLTPNPKTFVFFAAEFLEQASREVWKHILLEEQRTGGGNPQCGENISLKNSI